MKSKSTIEVNGKRYDAVTGEVLGVATAPPLRTNGRNIDGFFRQRTLTTPTIKTPPVRDSVASLASAPTSAPVVEDGANSESRRKVNHAKPHQPQHAAARTIRVAQSPEKSHHLQVRRGNPNHVRRHAVQHSRTLRRDTVPAPQPSTHNALKPKGALQHTAPKAIALKTSAVNINADRLARAQTSTKNPLVAHHGATSRVVAPMFASVAVQPTPTVPSAVPAPAPNTGDTPTVPPPQPTNKPTDIFEHALANANNFVDVKSHSTRYKKKVHTHVASMALGSLALIIIASFVAYQNNPGLQFKVASLKAGVSASMPNLAAAGFSFNGVRAGDGKLTVGFKGKGGTFQLTQTDTNMSDSDMIQSVGSTDATGMPTYLAMRAGEVTVYRLSNTNATWVSGGKWYTVSGTGALSNTQVKNLVQHV